MDNHTQILIAEKLYDIAAKVQDIADLLNPGNEVENAPSPQPTSIFNLNINLNNNNDEDDDDYWDDDDLDEEDFDDYDDEDEAPVSVFARTPVFSVFSARS